MRDVCSLPFADGEGRGHLCPHVGTRAEPSRALREMTRVLGVEQRWCSWPPDHAPDMPFRLKYRYSPFRLAQLIEWMTEPVCGYRLYPRRIARLFGWAYGAKA
jgi:hypothetical protein